MNLMMSTLRVAMRCARSCTVIASGMTTSRTTLGPSWPPRPRARFSRSRSRARRTDARERIRSSDASSPAATWMVNRPSRRLGSPFRRDTALAGSAAFFAPGPPRRRAPSSSSRAPIGRRSPARGGAVRAVLVISGVDGAMAPPPERGGPPGRGPLRGASAE